MMGLVASKVEIPEKLLFPRFHKKRSPEHTGGDFTSKPREETSEQNLPDWHLHLESQPPELRDIEFCCVSHLV